MKVIRKIYDGISGRLWAFKAKRNNFETEYLEEIINCVIDSEDLPKEVEVYFTNSDFIIENGPKINTKDSKFASALLEVNDRHITSCATSIFDDGKICIFISPELIQKEFVQLEDKYPNINFNDVYTTIKGTIKHEIYHCYQFRYIFDHYGADGINKVISNESNYPYGEGPLERGAIEYSITNGELKQNFDVVFNLN